MKQDKQTHARLGLIKTRRGDIETPYLVPVATMGSVRALGSDDLAGLGVQCSLANTYHLLLLPGDELIKRLGGLHRFMGFDRPIFTDSGGFQAFSLGFAREHNISKIGNIFPQELASSGQCPGLEESNYNDFRKKYDDMEKGGARGIGYRENERGRPKAAKKENFTKITDEGISFKSLADGAWHF
ncbi:MAG: tRNA-guanine transglycosylase, partial [Methanothrix sp.]|nr:tRNA-guanine transglycosylase [Methanothrix sp.]